MTVRMKCLLGLWLFSGFVQTSRVDAADVQLETLPASKLLLDDYWIESQADVCRVLHQPEKHSDNPLIRGDDVWAANPYCYGTAMYDPATSGFQLWYQSYNHGLPLADRTPILFATSVDGIAWDRPALGLVDFGDSRQNNILMSNYGHHDLYSPSVVKDDRDPDAQRRYKMVWWDFPKGKQGYRDDGMCVAFSPDGIHWDKYAGNPVLAAKKQERSISDVVSVMYDSRAEKFVVYSKGWADPWPAHRQIVRTESSDFVNWSEPEVVLRHAFNQHDPQSYGMVVTQYESAYVGLLCSYKNPGDETIDIQLTVSHDNLHWNRVADQKTFLPLGSPGSWDDGMLFCAPFIAVQNKLLIYYGAWDGPHNSSQHSSGIGLATLRKDGFVSLDAGAEPGTVTTRLLHESARPLLINADARHGSVRVEVRDQSGKVWPGYSADDCMPLTSDATDHPIRWKTHTTLPASEAGIRLHFLITNASLYSFR